MTAELTPADPVLEDELGPSSPDLAFVTTPRADDAAPVPELRFTLDGQLLVARRPKEAGFAMLAQAAARGARPADKIAALLGFLDSSLDDASASYLHARLTDPEDPLELDTIVEVMQRLVDKWGDETPNRSQRRARSRA